VAQLRGPTGFYQVGSILVTNVEAVLAASAGGPVERACVVPGEIAWDGCNCGLLAVSVRRWFLTDNFPESGIGLGGSSVASRATPCDLPYLVGELRVQVIRCAPIPDGNAISVPCSDLDAAAQVLLSDAYVTLTEVVSTLCELRETDQIIDYVLGEQETLGPAGDCVGSELVAQVALVR
jgi:hypothetical protein